MTDELDPNYWEPDAAWEAELAAEREAEPEAPDAPLAEAPARLLETPVPPEASAGAPDAPTTVGDPWHTYDAAWLCAARLEPQIMLVPRLDIGRGRACGLVGRDGAGKSDAATAIALAVMSGRPAWGNVPCSRGRVLHVTYDMGRYANGLRYRRIANGMGIAFADLQGRFELAEHPEITLCTQAARKKFAARFTGFDLVIVDNLRSAIPKGDENSSEFGAFMSTLNAAAGDAKCTVLYLHHTGKDGQGSGRGTGAIPAASGAIWRIEGQKGEARRLTQERLHDNSDGPKDDLWLTRTELDAKAGPFDTNGGASWRYEAHTEDPKKAASGKTKALRARILEAVRETPGIGRKALRTAAGGKHTEADSLIDALRRDGTIENRGDANNHKYYTDM